MEKDNRNFSAQKNPILWPSLYLAFWLVTLSSIIYWLARQLLILQGFVIDSRIACALLRNDKMVLWKYIMASDSRTSFYLGLFTIMDAPTFKGQVSALVSI